MTETMLERAAVALMNRQRSFYGLDPISVGMFDPEEVGRAKEQARAVLMAVREPEIGIGGDVFYTATSTSVAAEQERKYTSMIDAILNEGER